MILFRIIYPGLTWAFHMFWRHHWSSDALHRYHFQFSVPFLSAASIPTIIDDDDDDVAHLMPRRRCRIVTLARDCCSSDESSQRCHRKHIVTNISLPFFLCAACQNGLDHRRWSGIVIIRSYLIVPFAKIC